MRSATQTSVRFRATLYRTVAVFCPSPFSIVVVNKNRTNARTTVTTTHVNRRALLLARGVSALKRVDYGPTVNNVKGKRLMGRISTLNNLVTGTVSRTNVRFEVLGTDGKPTIHTAQTRTSHILCHRTMHATLRGRPGLVVFRRTIRSLVIRGSHIINTIARVKLGFHTGTIILAIKAFLSNGVRVNLSGCDNNHTNSPPSVPLSHHLHRLPLHINHLGAKAPPHVSTQAVSFDILTRRRNSGPVPMFSFVNGTSRRPRRIPYCVARAGRGARSIVHDGLSHDPVCTKIVRNINPHCYPSVRSGIVHFTSEGRRRVFLRPRKLASGRVCPGNVSADLPFSIRVRVIHSVRKVRGTGVIHPNCTVRCSFFSPHSLGPALRDGFVRKLFFTNRVGNAANCRRTTTRNLLTNLGTTHLSTSGRN